MLKPVVPMLLLCAITLILPLGCRAEEATVGTPVSYSLPAGGQLPQTYRVTLAIVDAKNPDWIISQFLAGQPRSVTPENGGHFTDYWNGLDDNFMPVPPGTYGVKGIFMPAEKWEVDGEYHSIVPQLVTGISPWMPRPEQWKDPASARLYAGDPSGGPSNITDVDVGTNGVAVFYYGYLENSANNVQVDLTKPIGHEQLLNTYDSGGVGGGTCTCTDGESIWSLCSAGSEVIYRADRKPFGNGAGSWSRNVTLAEGSVKAMAAYRDQAAGKSYVYVAEAGKFLANKPGVWPPYLESNTELVDKVLVYAGENGQKLAEVPVHHPRGMVARYGTLYVLHQNDAGAYLVSSVALAAGLPQGALQPLFTVPATITPFDLEQDSHGRFYLSDTGANQVYQLDGAGKVLRTFGRLAAQKPGSYDPETFMSPGKLATWRDPDGNDRLLVVDQAGPTNTSEWSADGKLLRQFVGLQTNANNYGYAIDPEHPEDLYILGARGWLTRFKMDYAGATYKVDAVWPDIGTDPLLPETATPRLMNVQGRKYLGFSIPPACCVYRLEGDRWILSAGIVRKDVNNQPQWFSWHDANGDGQVQEEELTPMQLPAAVFGYWGEQWLDDLSLLAVNQEGRDVWRLIPTGFDAHQNPLFTKWEKTFTDPIFAARAQNTADAVHGGNGLDDRFSCAWAMARGSVQDGFYVTARGGPGGPGFSANMSPQDKISRYVPDGKGGYALKWRTGRQALNGRARPGEIVGSIFIEPPINGLVSVIDNTRCGVLLYTQDGLYVETLFPQRPASEVGIYWLPGEFFKGIVYPNPKDGSIYIGVGKATPMIFKAQGWSLTQNPVQPLTSVQKTVTIAANQIGDPPEIALTLRGNAGAQKIARFAPATGGAVLDGSLTGWESCEPVQFQAADNQTVEVRTLYDPENLYLRWHARLSTTFDPKPLAPVERIFSHGRMADTLSFYIQGDLNAKPNGSVNGRPGDVRIVFGIFKDNDTLRPVALGMYPVWQGVGKPTPEGYLSPVSKVEFAHVGILANAKLSFVLDEDGKGFVLVAGIPRSDIPGLPQLSGEVRTMVDFEATFAGHNKFWWANSDGSASRETYDEPTEARLYPGAWAPAQFQKLDKGLVVHNWLLCGPFGGPGAEKFAWDLRDNLPGTTKDYKQAGREFCEAATYPPDDGKVDLQAVYQGAMVRGYWPDPGPVRWHAAKTADLDTRVICGTAAQVWYGASWIFAPADTPVQFQFQGHPQTYYRWFLNGEKVLEGGIGGGDPGTGVTAKPLTLRQGWNQVFFRGYCVGYSPFRAGLVLSAPPETLWTLRLSATPPK